jgi:putative MATE family efflux protein
LVELTELDDSPPKLLKLLPEFRLVRKVLYLGSFVMLAMITQYFVNAADNFMVGRLPAAEATASQAALALGMPLYWAIGGFFAAISYGTQAITARRFAEKDELAAGRVLFNSVWVAIIAGLLGTAIGYYSSPASMGFIATASPEQESLGLSYVQLRMLGVAGMVVTFSFKAFFDGIGRTYVHLIAAVVMNFLNIGLNYFLIYGHEDLGIPRMGLDGAGLASMLSTYVGLVIMIAVSLLGRYRKRFRFYRWKNRDFKVAKEIVTLMLPSGSATVILMGGFLMFMSFVGRIDADLGGQNTYSAATGVIMQVGALCFMPLLAFGTATATAVSQSLGAKKPNLAARYGWESVRVGLWAVMVAAVAFWFFPEEIISWWAPEDPAVAAVSVGPMRLVASCLPMMVVGLILSQALYGAGANTYVMVVELCLHLFVLVPLSYLLGPYLGYGMMGIWSSAIIYVNLLGIAMGIKFMGKGWRTIQL